VVCLSAGHRGHAAGGLLRQPLRALSASPGSLYTYAADTLPPAFGVIAAWGLLLAYIATGASVAGGALYYAGVLSQQFFHGRRPRCSPSPSSAARPD
jgi:amino acid transporter